MARARGVSTTTCSRLLAGGPASRMPELERTESATTSKTTEQPPTREDSDSDTRLSRKTIPARLGSSPADRAFTRGVRAGIRRSARVKSACTRPIRSSSLACSAGLSSRFHWRALPEAFQQRWIFGGDRSWACAARSLSAMLVVVNPSAARPAGFVLSRTRDRASSCLALHRGHLAQDGRGRDCKDARAAYAFAIKSMPGHLRKGLKATSTHVSTQICDDQDETIAVVRGTVTIERWRAASFTALSPRFQSSPPVP